MTPNLAITARALLEERLRLRAALEQIRDMDDGVVFACARAIAAAALGNAEYECPEKPSTESTVVDFMAAVKKALMTESPEGAA